MLERTAPRAVADCPKPWPEDAWKSTPDLTARTFEEPPEALRFSGLLIDLSERLRDQVALEMLRQGSGLATVSSGAGVPQEQLRESREREERSRQRLEYSRAYYDRHPGRIPGQWYAVEEGDPDLPKTGISVPERQA